MKSPFQLILLALTLSRARCFAAPSSRSILNTVAEAQTSTQLNNSLLTTVFAGADAFFRNSPYVAAAVVCSIKASTADIIAQRRHFKKRREEGDDLDVVINSDGSLTTTEASTKVDFRRNLAYMVYGAFYQGLFLEHSYNHIYPWMFGTSADFFSVVKKVSFDMMFQSPVLTLPIAYLSKALIFRYPFREAIRRYVDDVMNHKLLLKYYILWIPMMVIAFGFVPDHFRVTFCASISFFWMIILSSISNKNRDGDDECELVDGSTCNIDG